MSDELLNAIFKNNIYRVRELVTQGVDINKEDKYGTPLLNAISYDNIDMVRFLVKELGVDINKESIRGITPLMEGIYRGKIDMVRFLVKELGVDINKEDKYGTIPLIQAISKGKIDIVKLLKEVTDINKQDSVGNTPLIRASLTNDFFNLNELVKLGADVNKKNKYGKTAYSYARCKPEILEVLKKAGAIIEDFEENKLLYLSHKTTLNNLSGILESKKIYTDVDMWYRNTTNLGFAETENTWTPSSITSPEIYPGVYMTLINNELVGNKIELTNIVPICLVFCISLLNREDFHHNNDWVRGKLYSDLTTFNITELQNSIKKNCIQLFNEIIFHHSVSLKYLKEIWVYDDKTYNKVKDMLVKNSMDIPVQITNNYLDESRICDETIEKLPTNYCYFPIDKDNCDDCDDCHDCDDYDINEELKDLKISEEEINAFYNKNINSFLSEDGIEMSQI